ncbi:hypothetical protein [Paramaledivibacter caminithermalis]|jgi:ethanolamine utilization protein|uniref:Ethanolamine utilization protein n=1 Tax=Paramaledivibacter caminithermalis (strain DSM 15212 / CIP 107654 / DViRD3) TaxID=1121301 RepID=A0A1M6PNG7_PARC5|nr:hypothetical protein [Paramaledivibacter caminithermalis]SHK09467.1 ethanolamine utilization protein [Paramaledivibacter caminithermalis DSM 15212]
MNTDNLIKIITEEVLKRITMLNSQSIQEKSKSILIIDLISEKDKNSYSQIISNWKNVSFLDDYCHKDGVDSFDYIILPRLSNKDLVNIAIGNPNSEISEIIIDGIFKGKKIIVLESGISYRKYKSTANKNFFNMFKGYEEKMISFGIEVVKEENLLDCLNNKAYKDSKEMLNSKSKEEVNKDLNKEEAVKKVVINKRVISEKDIENLWNKGYSTININKKSIITPLAKDFIRTNEINIQL